MSAFLVNGQNYHCRKFSVAEFISLDSLPVEASSIELIPKINYRLDTLGTGIYLEQKPAIDSVQICFRTVSPVFHQPLYERDESRYISGAYSREKVQNKMSKLPEEQVFSFGNLETYGAITRGVSFGNRQNVFVNSALNLQMNGNLSDDLKVSAVITDQNIPYQPDGNTQQIRDFDNVFIKLYNEDFEVTAGDVVLQNPVADSYFLQYYKNVQGLALKYHYQLNDKWKGRSQATGSLAKGQFMSAVVEPEEGVQGPYLLSGANDESYIVIMANSERVYLDGELLERGFDRDYVIDYNEAELTFSNSIVITQYSRIRVDYEYANQYYSRSNLSATQEIYSDRTNIYFNYYREKDNPSATLSFDLEDDEIAVLSQLGDNGGEASISGVDSTGYIEDAILYARKDTVETDGTAVVIYEYSTSEDSALYQISFTSMGSGSGSYSLLSTTTNGRIYEWVGDGNGTYDPIQVITLPNQKQMVVMGVRTKISEFESAFAELAISKQDQNLYSPLEDGDNVGWAWKTGLESNDRNVPILSKYRFSGSFSYEFDQRNFTYIDRFRSVDYDRDWGYDVYSDSILARQDEIIAGAVSLKKNAGNKLSYDISFRNRLEVVNGMQQTLNVSQTVGPFQLSSQNYLMDSELDDEDIRWFKSSNQIQLTKWVLRPGYTYSINENTTALVYNDSITSTSMHYRSHNFFIETGDSLKVTGKLYYLRRDDQTPQEGVMKDYTHAEEVGLSLQSAAIKNQQIASTVNYRKVNYVLGDEDNEKNVLGKISWMGYFADRHISNNVTFTTANSRELKREFVYVRVATGQGTYTWRDENEDGVQDLNEFYEAVNEDEKNYVKIFTSTSDYINAYQTTYVHSVDMRMPQGWKNRDYFLSTLSKLSLNVNLKYNFKTTSTGLEDRLNPFNKNLENDSILSASNLVRNTVYFNRNAPGFGFDVSRSKQSSKSLLSSGYELKEKDDWLSTFRIVLGSIFTIRGEAGLGQTYNSSDYLDSRNFQLDRVSYEGEVVWQPLNSFRLITGAGYRTKMNVQGEDDEHSRINEYSMGLTWIRSTKGNLNASFSWLAIGFKGDESTYLGYELLEALEPGNNQKWTINWQQSLGRGLQLSLQYFGRKSPESAMVHTGSVNVTAYF